MTRAVDPNFLVNVANRIRETYSQLTLLEGVFSRVGTCVFFLFQIDSQRNKEALGSNHI